MTLAIAATVLGVTGTLSVAGCRTALRHVEVAQVPRHLLPRSTGGAPIPRPRCTRA